MFLSGVCLCFWFLEIFDDVVKYQGQNLLDVGVEEVGNYFDFVFLDCLWGVICGFVVS